MCSSPIGKKCSVGHLWPLWVKNGERHCSWAVQLQTVWIPNSLPKIYYHHQARKTNISKPHGLRGICPVFWWRWTMVFLLLYRVNSEHFSAGSWNLSVRLLKSALKIDFSTCERPTEMTRNSCCLFNTSLPYWLHTLWPENQQKSPKNHPSEKSDYMRYLHFLPKADLDTVMSKCPK